MRYQRFLLPVLALWGCACAGPLARRPSRSSIAVVEPAPAAPAAAGMWSWDGTLRYALDDRLLDPRAPLVDAPDSLRNALARFGCDPRALEIDSVQAEVVRYRISLELLACPDTPALKGTLRGTFERRPKGVVGTLRLDNVQLGRGLLFGSFVVTTADGIDFTVRTERDLVVDFEPPHCVDDVGNTVHALANAPFIARARGFAGPARRPLQVDEPCRTSAGFVDEVAGVSMPRAGGPQRPTSFWQALPSYPRPLQAPAAALGVALEIMKLFR